MAKSDDLVKYITQQVVTYIETPREVRKQQRLERKAAVKEPWGTRWFGMLPLAIEIWLGGRKRKKTSGQTERLP